MSQHDFNIANQTASNARADINNALTALASLSSGSTAPTTTYANMLWYDTGTNTLKQRNEADSAWISVRYLDQTNSQFQIFDDTKVVNSSGTQTGLIGDQATATWEAGTATDESLVSPAKIKSAIQALAPEFIDYSTGMSSYNMSSTTVRNTTGRIRYFYYYQTATVGETATLQMSSNGSTYYTISTASVTIPARGVSLWFPNYYLRYTLTKPTIYIIG